MLLLGHSPHADPHLYTMTRYLCLVDVFDTDGSLLGSEGDTIELFPASPDKRARKRAAAILMANGDRGLRSLGETEPESKPEPKKKATKKKSASYKTRQAKPE